MSLFHTILHFYSGSLDERSSSPFILPERIRVCTSMTVAAAARVMRLVCTTVSVSFSLSLFRSLEKRTSFLETRSENKRVIYRAAPRFIRHLFVRLRPCISQPSAQRHSLPRRNRRSRHVVAGDRGSLYFPNFHLPECTKSHEGTATVNEESSA